MKATLHVLVGVGVTIGLCACGSINSDVAVTRNTTTYHRAPTVALTTASDFDPEPVDTVLRDPASVQGSPKITINLSEQKAFLYKGSTLVGISRVSTGKSGYRTPSGSYHVTEKDVDHRSSLYGDYVDSAGRVVRANVDVRIHSRPPGSHFLGAPMSYFLRFNGGIGMHAGYLPGYPASHGCVRMPSQMASLFYRHVGTGTPVKVVY